MNVRSGQWTGCVIVTVVCREDVGGQNADLRPLWEELWQKSVRKVVQRG